MQKILLLGGNGNMSWHCTKKLVELGNDVYVINRGLTKNTRKKIDFVQNYIVADVNNFYELSKKIDNNFFDVVIDFICYDKVHASNMVNLFLNKTKQFVFVSSTAGYVREGYYAPITEKREMKAMLWEYSRNKIEAEEVFLNAKKQLGFPVTVLRPGHTYDTIIPEAVGNGDWTITNRIINNKPIVVHGDGTNWWTLTHSEDFACALSGIISNPDTVGEIFNVVGDEVVNWLDITLEVANGVGVSKPCIVHIPTDRILEKDFKLGVGISEHKKWNDIYDNSKLKMYVPKWTTCVSYKSGIKRTIDWLSESAVRRRLNDNLDKTIDALCMEYM